MTSEKRAGEPDTYLTFTLAEEVFALGVSHVREVLEMVPITRVPRMPVFLRGVINLRGNVVPVVDLRAKMGLPPGEQDRDSCIIVIEMVQEGDTTVVGALVDGVKEVFELSPDQIEPPPRMGTQLDTFFLRGMARHEDRFLILLDADRVFSTEEITAFRSAGESGGEEGAVGEQVNG